MNWETVWQWFISVAVTLFMFCVIVCISILSDNDSRHIRTFDSVHTLVWKDTLWQLNPVKLDKAGVRALMIEADTTVAISHPKRATDSVFNFPLYTTDSVKFSKCDICGQTVRQFGYPHLSLPYFIISLNDSTMFKTCSHELGRFAKKHIKGKIEISKR